MDGLERSRSAPRRAFLAAALLVAGGFAALAALGGNANRLLLVSARRAATSRGLALQVEGEPRLGLRGLETGRVTIDDSEGRRLLEAGALRVRWLPWVALALEGDDLSFDAGASVQGSGAPPLLLPESVASLRLSRAAVRLGAGRSIEGDARIVREGDRAERWHFERLAFHEDSGEVAAEGLSGTLLVAPGEGDEGTRMELRVEAGTVLAGAVLLDLSIQPLDLAATVDERGGGPSLRGVRGRLGDLVAVEGDLAGDAAGDVQRLSLQASSANLSGLFATFVREPFAAAWPLLSTSFLEGRASLKVRQDTPSRRSLQGELTASLGRAGGGNVEAGEVELALPWAGPESRAVQAAGRIEAGRLLLGGLSWKGVGASLRASPGRLETTGARTWSSPAGSIRVERLVLGQREGLVLEADVVVEGLDAGALVPGMSGRFHGNLGRMRLDGRRLSVDGALDLEVFGGRVLLSGLGIDDPFGRVPALRAQVDVRDLDLGAASAAAGFGRIEGILEGQVRGLVVAGGQAQAFDADLHTVERKGVSQTVDVRAITQLGVLGGGDSSATNALLGLVDRYRYAALGVKCRLRNDTFELRGVETRDGRDYLVKGTRLPPSVSVVSHSQVVSFSEMLRRMERITRLAQGGT